MFDVSFSELLLIGVIALIVIGPERLPGVARTIGHLVGRAQRYVNDVKSDIQREVDLGEINNLKDQMSDAANSVKASLENVTKDLKQPAQEARDAFKDASESVNSLVNEAKASAQDAATDIKETVKPTGDTVAATKVSAQAIDAPDASGATPDDTAAIANETMPAVAEETVSAAPRPAHPPQSGTPK